MLAGSSRFAKGATAASRQFRFDTVQMPLNVMDAHYDSFEKNVLPALIQNDIGVLGIEADGRPHHSGERNYFPGRMNVSRVL